MLASRAPLVLNGNWHNTAAILVRPRFPDRPGRAPTPERKFAVWGALALIGSMVSAAEASPSDLFGLGARNQGLAGTGASHEVGFAATYLNPAMLAHAPDRRLGLGLAAARMKLDARSTDPKQPALEALDDDSEALVFGVTTPLTLPSPLDDRLALGLGVSTPGATIARVDLAPPSEPRFPLLGSRAESLAFSLGLGLRVHDDWSLGVGSMLLASLEGSVALDAGADGTARSLTDDRLVLTRAPLFGIIYSPNPWSLALVWRSELRSDFDMVVSVDDLGGLVLPDLNVVGLSQIDPSQWVAEASYQSRRWTAAAGVTWKRWSLLDGFVGATVRCPHERPDCAALPPRDLGLRDTWVPRAALEHALPLPGATALFRFGYFFEPSALPAARADIRVFDNPRHVVTAGYAVALRSDDEPDRRLLEVGIGAQYHLLVPRTHSTQPHSIRTSGNLWSFAFDVEVGF